MGVKHDLLKVMNATGVKIKFPEEPTTRRSFATFANDIENSEVPNIFFVSFIRELPRQVQVPVPCTVSGQKYSLRKCNDMMIYTTGVSFLA
jgi:hypothetical protein